MTEPDVLTPKQARGCSTGLAIAVALAVAAFLLFGCAPTYTVIPADREVVPVCQNGTLEDGRKTYIETEAAATGWYVPDATMLELLEAD